MTSRTRDELGGTLDAIGDRVSPAGAAAELGLVGWSTVALVRAGTGGW